MIDLAKKRAKKLVETDIVLAIRVVIAKMAFAMTWRNNTGVLRDERGRPVKFGLCEGSSDLIGITEVIITADMVGKKIGRFTAIEVKQLGKRPTDDQSRFLDVVKARGGAATWVTSVDDVAPWLEKAKVMTE